jgi:flagellar protein FliO/FliZ
MHCCIRRLARVHFARPCPAPLDRPYATRLLLAALALAPAGSLYAQNAGPQTANIPAAVAAVSSGGYLQMMFGLAIVLGLVGALAWLMKRVSALPGTGAGMIRVLGAAAVGQRERVVLVEVGETWVLLGVAPGQVRPLHTMPKEKSSAAATAVAPADQGFAMWLRRMMDKRGND